jgi:hypothetical protein
MRFLLRVEHPNGTVHEYDASRIERSNDPEIYERASDDSIEVGDLELSVDGPFLGAYTVLDLPLGTDADPVAAARVRYRAEVVEYETDPASGVVTMNGVIHRRGGLTREPEHERWVAVIQDDAVRRYLEDLEALRLDDASTGRLLVYRHDSEGIPVYHRVLVNRWYMVENSQRVRRTAWGIVRDVVRWQWGSLSAQSTTVTTAEEQLSTQSWLSPEGVIYYGAKLAGHEWIGPGSDPDEPLFQETIEYSGGEHVHKARVGIGAFNNGGAYMVMDVGGVWGWTYEGNANNPVDGDNHPLQNVTVRTILEGVQAMLGWRLTARYEAFPSRKIIADAIEQHDLEPIDPPVIDSWREGSIESGQGRTFWRIEAPEAEDLAIVYGGFGSPNGEIFYQIGPLDDGSVYGPVQAYPQEMYAASLRPLIVDERGAVHNEDRIELPFRLPWWDFEIHSFDTIAPGLTMQQWGANVAEPAGADGSVAAGLYIGELMPSPSKDPEKAGMYRYLAFRMWGIDGSPHFASPSIAPHLLIAKHQRSARESVTVSVLVDLDATRRGLFGVGDPRYGVVFQGYAWTVDEVRRGIDGHTALLNLSRPSGAMPYAGGDWDYNTPPVWEDDEPDPPTGEVLYAYWWEDWSIFQFDTSEGTREVLSPDANARIGDPNTEEGIWQFPPGSGIAFDPDRRRLYLVAGWYRGSPLVTHQRRGLGCLHVDTGQYEFLGDWPGGLFGSLSGSIPGIFNFHFVDGRLWVRLEGRGIYTYDPDTGQFILAFNPYISIYPPSPNNISQIHSWAVSPDGKYLFLMKLYHSLIKIDLATGSVVDTRPDSGFFSVYDYMWCYGDRLYIQGADSGAMYPSGHACAGNAGIAWVPIADIQAQPQWAREIEDGCGGGLWNDWWPGALVPTSGGEGLYVIHRAGVAQDASGDRLHVITKLDHDGNVLGRAWEEWKWAGYTEEYIVPRYDAQAAMRPGIYPHPFALPMQTETATTSAPATLAVERFYVDGADIGMASMPTARSQTLATSYQGRVHVIGGTSDATTGLTVHEAWNPTANTWETRAALPEPVRGGAIGVIGDHIYVATGVTSGGTRTAKTWRYDGSTDSWDQVASIGAGVFAPAYCVAEGYLWVIGGSTSSGLTNHTQRYDPVTDTWAYMATIGTLINESMAAPLSNGTIVLMGGSTASYCRLYTIATNVWSAQNNLPNARARGAGFGFGDLAYYMLGTSSTSTTTYVLSALRRNAQNSWTTVAFAPTGTGRRQPGYAILNGIGYIVGGENASGFLNTMIAFTGPDLVASPNSGS